ncbi:MAG: ATP-binding cassette domain-containing protein [Kofleriaceae bacterium]
MIVVRELTKHFRVHQRPPGLRAAMRSLVRRDYTTVEAVRAVSFTIERGERVGFLGPNGAGKTTTLKLLSGLLHPTSGSATVDGHRPYARDHALLRAITLVMGQKQQLLWDLPPAETFELNRAIYGVPRAQHEASLAELTALLELGDLTRKPTRQLSLGERMKCELTAALLHRPTTLFLDEPTIGLDVAMQVAIRDFIRAYNERHEATVMLTSHYMDDVVALCPRVIVIDGGAIVHDGDLRALVRRVDPHKTVGFTLPAGGAGADPRARLGVLAEDPSLTEEGGRFALRVPQARLPEVVSHLLGALGVVDLSVEDPPIEDVMRSLFAHRGGGSKATP